MATILSTTPIDAPEAQYKNVCEVQNVHPSLVNAIRRTLLSEIPNVGFDVESHNDMEKNSIRIRTNTSALHNEFITHRVGLVPICVKDSGRLNIRSTWNDATGVRENRFAQDGTLTFTCNVKNNEATREARLLEHREKDIDPVNDMLLVTTLDFECSEGDAKEYLRPDPMIRGVEKDKQYTTYILLNKLKKGNEGALHIECSPRVGTGCTHSLYSPVGTAAYKFVEEPEEIQTGIFEQWLQKANQERAEKKLPAFSAAEEAEQRVSFNMLDAKRVYQRDSRGDANRVQLTVESVGGHHPMKITQYALQSIYHRLQDIVVCFRAETKDGGVQYGLNNKDKSWVKVACVPSFAKMDATDFILHGESHTLANPITKHMQLMFQGEDATVGNYLDFVSYTKPHPLNEKVHFRIKLREDLDARALLEKIQTHADSVDPLLREALEGGVDEMEDGPLHAFLVQFLFIQGVNKVIYVVQTLLTQWTAALEEVDTGANKQFLLWSEYSVDTAQALYADVNMARLLA